MKSMLYLNKVIPICAALAMLTIFASCKKDSSSSSGGNSNYYIKAKFDGTEKAFNVNAIAAVLNLPGVEYSVAITGRSSSNNADLTGINIAFNFYNGKQLEVKTYTEDDASTDYDLAGIYNPNSVVFQYGSGLVDPSAKTLKVTILTKSSSEITGTFEGAFYRQIISTADVPGEFITVTDGTFKVPLK